MTTSNGYASPPSSLESIRTAAQDGSNPSIGDPRPAYGAVVFVGAWNSSGVRVPSTREKRDTAIRCPGSP